MSEPRRGIEKECSFSIETMGPWDFWAKAGQLQLPENVSMDTANQVAVLKAIALRDMEAPSERRN